MSNEENPRAAAARERHERGLYLNDVLARAEDRTRAELQAAIEARTDHLAAARQAVIDYATTTRTVTADGLAPLLERLEIEAEAARRPSRFYGKPAEINAWLREDFAEDTLLAFYQWIGARAVTEAAEDIRQHPGPIPYKPPSTNGYWWDSRDRDAAADLIDPNLSGGPYPSTLGDPPAPQGA